MKIVKLITRTVRSIATVMAEAPAVHRELQRRRTERTPAAPVPAPLTAADVKGEPPTVAEIETAARAYDQARTDTNTAARLKRQAEKILRRTPDGAYGAVKVERFASSRQTADLDAIKAIFEARNLGDIPMKQCAPSITISWAAEATIPAELTEPAELAAA